MKKSISVIIILTALIGWHVPAIAADGQSVKQLLSAKFTDSKVTRPTLGRVFRPNTWVLTHPDNSQWVVKPRKDGLFWVKKYGPGERRAQRNRDAIAVSALAITAPILTVAAGPAGLGLAFAGALGLRQIIATNNEVRATPLEGILPADTGGVGFGMR